MALSALRTFQQVYINDSSNILEYMREENAEIRSTHKPLTLKEKRNITNNRFRIKFNMLQNFNLDN